MRQACDCDASQCFRRAVNLTDTLLQPVSWTLVAERSIPQQPANLLARLRLRRLMKAPSDCRCFAPLRVVTSREMAAHRLFPTTCR